MVVVGWGGGGGFRCITVFSLAEAEAVTIEKADDKNHKQWPPPEIKKIKEGKISIENSLRYQLCLLHDKRNLCSSHQLLQSSSFSWPQHIVFSCCNIYTLY